MAINIPVPNSSYAEQFVSLDSSLITMLFTFNVVNQAWYISLYDSLNAPIKLGIKVMENQNLTKRFSLDEFENGDLWCIRVKNNSQVLGRDNFGVDKTFELLWVSKAEANRLGVGDAIQF